MEANPFASDPVGTERSTFTFWNLSGWGREGKSELRNRRGYPSGVLT